MTLVTGLIEKGIESRGGKTREVIGTFGQMCSVETALPGIIHLLTTYEVDFKRALVENILAGGDSAARGMPVGMILGAHLGLDAIPGHWLKELNTRNKIQGLLDTLSK